MLTIDRMTSDLRLAGSFAARERLAQRLDRVVRHDVAAALAPVAADHADEAGPVVRVRRIDLRLWLLPDGMTDEAIARRWAAAIARALSRQLAEAGPDAVARYPDHAAYLAAWVRDLLAGNAAGRWEYRDFVLLDGLPPGRAMAAALARDKRWTAPAFAAIAAQGSLTAAIAKFAARDVAALWLGWTGAAPEAPARVDRARLARVAGRGIAAPAMASGGTDAHGRTALGWLIALTTGPDPLPPAAAAPLAMQLGHLSVLAAAGVWDDPANLAAALVALPRHHATAAGWLSRALAADAAGVEALRAVAGATRTAAAHMASAYLGVALLLPALAAGGLAERLGADGRRELLAAAIPPPDRLLARVDPALRLLAGVPDDAAPAPIDWPGASELRIDPDRIARDAATHGDIPALPALCAVLDGFADGLRHMSGSSADYLARQFLMAGGTVAVTTHTVAVRLHPMPLGVLLTMAGRTGDAGAIDWLGGRRLVLEIGGG